MDQTEWDIGGLTEATERVRQMERCFDHLRNSSPQDDNFRQQLELLTAYYEGGQWLHDYELDEKGLFPPDLKRGVLSQDAVFDFLAEIQLNDRGSF